MALLRYKSRGTKVKELQETLIKLGYNPGTPDGIFGRKTEEAVKQFQGEVGLDADGIVGNMTWTALYDRTKIIKYDSLQEGFIEYHLNDNEYFKEVIPKDTIYLHHTAGSARPDYVIDGWERDKSSRGGVLRVGTAFVIGRKTGGAANFDGVIYRAFKAKYWAHHLGTKRPKHKKYSNAGLNKKSIAIEICSYGPLKRDAEGFYVTFGTKRIDVPESEVFEIDKPWRGHKYFQRYTEKQIASLKKLLIDLAILFDIEIPDHKYDRDWFDLKFDALNGEPGLWTHVNVREDKTDCFPQPELIDMLNGLHAEVVAAKAERERLIREFVNNDNTDTEDNNTNTEHTDTENPIADNTETEEERIRRLDTPQDL